jgi:NAD(P)-dependent dehydrogenase (short-subunit alcohol dehydrogenase family)
MKVFVTGASGFIGRHLCRLLVARGHQITALVRRAERAPPGVRHVVGDITRPATYRGALAWSSARARARLGWDPGALRPALADYLASLASP